jgi:hypothetical protein
MKLAELKKIVGQYNDRKQALESEKLRIARAEEKQRVVSGQICRNCCYWFNVPGVHAYSVCLRKENYCRPGRHRTLEEVEANLNHWKPTDSCSLFHARRY